MKLKTIMLSNEGIKNLKKEIRQLEAEIRDCIKGLHELDKTLIREDRLNRIEKIAELESLESNLNEKRALLQSSKLLPRKRHQLRVALGSIVELIDRNGRCFKYKIVDSLEANPSDGKISAQSPIGRNLIGRTVKDIVEWSSGKYTQRLQLVRII